MDDDNGNKHQRVLEEAFRNLLVQSGTDTKIRIISKERGETTFRRDLLTFYSRQLREIIVSLSKTVTCSPDSDLVVHMPDFSLLTIIKLRGLLEEGVVPGQSSEGEIRDVLEAAVSLGVEMGQLGQGGEIYHPASASVILPSPVPITPLVTSTVSVKQEIVYQDQPGDQTGEQSLLFTSDQGPGQETHSSQSRPNQQTQFGCQKCRRYSKSLKSLKAHYIVEHYSKDLSRWIQGDECLECSKTFGDSTKLLLHLGFAHKKLEDCLARDGLGLDDPVSHTEVRARPVPPASSKSKSKSKSGSRAQRKSPKQRNISPGSSQPPALTQDSSAEAEPAAAAAENLTLELEAETGPSAGSVESPACNYSLQCESCKVEVKSDLQLEEHMCRHFAEELDVLVDQFIDSTDDPAGFTCRKCGDFFKRKGRINLHLGCKHGLINQVLRKKNLMVLPSSVNSTYSAAKQKKLRKIKKEKVEYEDSFTQDEAKKNLLMDIESET